MDSVSFKKKIAKIYNDINKELFESGVKSQNIEITGNKIIILAEHHRIPALKALDEVYRWKTRDIDVMLGDIFKLKFKEKLNLELNIEIKQLFRDYDPYEEMAATILILEK